MLFGVPIIMFLVIFNVMGTAIRSQEEKLEQTTYKIYTNQPDLIKTIFDNSGIKIQTVTDSVDIQSDLREKVFDIGIITSNPISSLEGLFTEDTGITLYSFSGSIASERIASQFASILVSLRDRQLRSVLTAASLDEGLLDKPRMEKVNVATEKEKVGSEFGGLLPYMLLIYLFTASFSVGFDTTAGEKERQTLTILLANRISRTSIAWGKIFYLMIMNVLSATVSVIAFFWGFSSMIPQTGNMLMIFTPETAVLMLLIVLSLAVLIAALITVIGIFAKSVKEASAYTLPIYIVTLVFGIMGLQPEMLQNLSFARYIPLINGIFSLKDLFTTLEPSYGSIVLTLAINLITAVFLVYLASKMFSDERFVFRTGS
jgi:sodium transport system permease protein